MKKNPSETDKLQPLRALLVEDNEDDSLLVIRELKKGGYNLVYERVETAAEMKKALNEKTWDIILCDYKLPKFSAPKAIELLKETGTDIPLIVISGTIGEETAIDCMKAGARDFFMKGKLSRLAAAIEREIKEAGKRQRQKDAEEALLASEEKYRMIADNMTDVITIMDMNLRFTFVSPSIFQLRGFTAEESMTQSLEEVLTPESLKLITEAYAEEMQMEAAGGADPNRTRVLELNEYRKDGSTIWVEASFSYLRDSNGKPVGILSLTRDCDYRKRAEEALRKSEEFFKEITENSSDIIVITDKKGDIKYCSRSIERYAGYKADELIGRSLISFIHPDDVKRAVADFGKAILAKDYAIPNEFRVLHKDGSGLYFEGVGKNFLDNPTIAGFIMNVRDITERRKAEEALRHSEERYRTFVENANDIVFRTDISGHFTFVNPVTLRIIGYSEEEIIGKHYKMFVHPDMIDEAVKRFVTQWKNLVKNTYHEFLIVTKDGQKKWIGQNTQLLFENGEPSGFQAVARDITDKKLMEEALQQSEEKYRTILESIDEGYFEVDLAGNFTFFNDSLCKILGYPQEEMMGMNNRQYSDAENAKILFQAFNEVYRTEKPTLGFDWRIIRKDGTERHIEASVALLKDSTGKKTGFRGTVRDVTNRKRVEEALRQSEERYRTVLDEMEEGYQEVDINGKITFINEAFIKICGFSREELLGTDYSMYTEAKDVERVYRAYNQMYKTGIPIKSLEMDIFVKNGTKRNTELYASLLRDSNNRPIGCRGIIRDVTERKQNLEKASKALQATVRAMASIVETRDPYTASHQRGVADLARAIAAEMNLAEEQIEGIHMAGTIHDIGKISVPAEILTKPGKLTEIEYGLVKTHPLAGYDILKDIEFPWPVADTVLQHHERIDGSGYPEGLKGEAILPEARILAVADVVEAIASHRPYRPALGIEAAIEEIYKNRLILYDGDTVDACIKLFREKGYKLV